MSIYIGSARHDEHGDCYTNGSAGDQLQTSTPDYSGEVSMQVFYVHSKGWHVLRPKSTSYADAIAERMTAACNNSNIGYDQNNRNGIITYGIDTKTKTECDCSSLVRECVKEATGTDPGDFTTANEVSALKATGLFDDIGTYTSSTILYNGDVLTTLSKGHTVIVVSGNPRVSEGWQKDSVGWWYRYADGTYPVSSWKLINHHWYYFGSDGYMKTGWRLINGEWYYLEGDNSEGYEGACWHEVSKHNGALERWYVD